VLFVDGDSTIEQRWVTSAIQFLETRPEASGVAGREDQIYFGKGEVVGFKADYFRTGNSEVQVKEFGGNAMYRRKALEEVGSFNPYIRSYEEAELGARLRKAGWVLVRIPVMMALHYTAIPDTLEEYRRRFRGHFFTGQGQVLRISIRQGTFWEHARGLNRVVFYILWITLGGLAMLGSAGFGTLVPILTWLSGGLVLLVCFVIRSRSLVKPFRMLLDWSVCSLPLIWGFLLSARDPEDFSLNEAIATDTAAPHTRRTRKGCLDDTGAKVLST
jgi:cellulose synthase/poly-beta-1,6-N-acetylglucosamine synthase-like glycosyltransferase